MAMMISIQYLGSSGPIEIVTVLPSNIDKQELIVVRRLLNKQGSSGPSFSVFLTSILLGLLSLTQCTTCSLALFMSTSLAFSVFLFQLTRTKILQSCNYLF